MNGREELRANDDWSVVSFVEEGDGLPDRLVGELEGRGWTLVASGQEGVWTGVKEGGRCSWLALRLHAGGRRAVRGSSSNAPMG